MYAIEIPKNGIGIRETIKRKVRNDVF